MKLFSKAAAAALFLFAPLTATAADITREIPVDTTFKDSMFKWDGNGDLMLRWKAVDKDGALEICGVTSAKGGSKYFRLNREVLRIARVKLGAETVMTDLSHFPIRSTATRADGMNGQGAACAAVGIETPENLEGVQLEFKGGRYRIRS